MQTDGQNHIGKVRLVVHRRKDDGAQTVFQLQRDLGARNGAQRVEQIAAVKADLRARPKPTLLRPHSSTIL